VGRESSAELYDEEAFAVIEGVWEGTMLLSIVTTAKGATLGDEFYES